MGLLCTSTSAVLLFRQALVLPSSLMLLPDVAVRWEQLLICLELEVPQNLSHVVLNPFGSVAHWGQIQMWHQWGGCGSPDAFIGV